MNKIAAGEVIERPASVVKELLENSVDALATRIEVDIVAGGMELVRIVDDGEGIHPEDLTLAVASHATSKLREADDLFRVQTLGFRGEALASIAEVSRFKLRSRRHDQPTGVELEVDSGVHGPVRPCGCPVGTTIEVRDLFSSTPVRRKFLKQPSTEFGHVSEQFTKIALAHPRLHLVLRHNDRVVYELPAAEKLLDRISLFFGADLAGHLIWVESEFENVRVWGYVGHPSQSKATRKGQYLFLNGRWITDRSLGHALAEAYRGLLMVGRNPVTFLFLEMPADMVDVNVHPTKAEVRFRESQKLYRQLLSTIRTKFLGMNLNSELTVRPAQSAYQSGQLTLGQSTSGQAVSGPAVSGFGGTGLTGFGQFGQGRTLAPVLQPPVAPRVDPARVDPERQRELQHDLVSWVKEQSRDWGTPGFEPTYPDLPEEPADNFDRAPAADEPPADWPATPGAEPGSEHAGFESGSTFNRIDESHAAGSLPAAPNPSDGLPATPACSFADVRAMQIHDSYLVVETEEGLQVVDQHALHERILYEQLRNRVLTGSVESQRLLVPQPVELSTAEAAILSEHTELLARFGLCLEEFGANTVLVTAYPVMLRRIDLTQMVRDAADKLAESGRDPSRRDLLDSLLHMMSCKGAVKAGQRLAPEEIESLLAQRHLIDDAHHCPHGRPTALVLSRNELDRQFGRLG